MRGIITFTTRFLKVDYQNMIPEVAIFAVGVWLLILVCAFLSIASQPISGKAKWLWVAVVVMVPLLGCAIYCVYCLSRQDYSFLKIFSSGKVMKVRKRGVGGAN